MYVQKASYYHKHNSLQASYALSFNARFRNSTFNSEEYKFGNNKVFMFQIDALSDYYVTEISTLPISLKVKFYKLQLDDKKAYAMKLSAGRFGDHHISCDDHATKLWRLIGTGMVYSKSAETLNFNVQVYTDVANPLVMLHDDDAESDFELCGEDGSIKAHKAVLGLFSPVLKTMLGGEWRETAEGRVNVPGTSQQTLKQLKDYMYLRKIPDTDFEQLMSLAKYYEMQELEQICIEKCAVNVSAENVWDVLEMLLKHKSNKMLISFFENLDEQNNTALVKKLAELEVRHE